jgi:hypothetical protein
MNDLFQSLTGMLQGDAVKNMAEKFGVGEEVVQKVVAMGLPMIVGGLNKNVTDPKGAESLNNALDQHDGSLLSNLSNAFSSNASNIMQDGMKILGHVLGSTQQPAQNQISKGVGVSSELVGNILSMAAPLVLEFLGQKKKEQGLDVKGIVNIVQTTAQQAPQKEMSMIEKFLDRNGDGSIVDDVMDIGSKFLSSFFGKKEEPKKN